MLKAVVELAAYGVAATLAAVCILAWAWKWGGWSWTAVSRQLRRSALAVMVAMAVVATMKAQKGNRGPGTTGDPPAPVQQTGTTGEPPVEDITDTFHFSAISVPTSGTVTLTTAWTNGLLTAGQTIDILVKTDLRNERWTWLTNGVVEADATNMSWTIENQSPSNSFYKAVVRDSLTDMDDPDGDGLPNVYELAHGRNPWVHDYALVQKLTVGPNGEFGDIVSALAESDDYSIIAVTPGGYQITHDIQMPPHPVMVTCEDGYAVFRGSSNLAMFLLGNGPGSGHTLFRNLYLNLTSTSGMQAGFWCGGGLPWAAPGAAAVFENVHIRAPNPGVEYFGWLFYAPCDAPAVIKGCCVNASGAEWIYAVFGDNPPPIVVESCSFVNFPTQSVYQSAAIGLRSTHVDGAITSTPPVALSRVLFDASFTNAWPLARFENAGGFPVTMTDCIRPSEPASSDFMADVTNNVYIATSEVAWAGFPLADSPAALLGIGAFAPLVNDPLADMDNDGISDYEEVYEHGTDPFLTDSDNDGVPDAVEILEDDTDPANPHSFKQRLMVAVTNTTSTAYALYAAWGYSATGWEPNDLARFAGSSLPFQINVPVMGGELFVKVFRDFNTNGVYDVDVDALVSKRLTWTDNGKTVTFNIGDTDRDGVGDSVEIGEGTNPLNNLDYCFSLSLTYTGVFQTTNALTFAASFGTNRVYGPCVVEGGVWTNDFGHQATTTGERVSVDVWDDANQNGDWDVGETSNKYVIAVTGHNMVVTNALSYGNFDRDNNELPDWWEAVHGLSTVTNGGPYADTDGDGLINLHECWAGTNPLIPDGSNTVLSVCSRSVGERVYGKSPGSSLCKFSSYAFGNWVANTNFWASGLDTSCASIWNSPYGRLRAGTLISERHMLFANHYPPLIGGNVYFLGTDGNVYSNTIVSTSRVEQTDILIALLSTNMPTAVTPAALLPRNYGEYINAGTRLPVMQFDFEEKGLICELALPLASYATTGEPLFGTQSGFYEPTIVGDSGDPVFLIIGNQPVLLGALHTGYRPLGNDRFEGGGSPFITYYASQIQAVMDSLCEGYTLRFFDFQGFEKLPVNKGEL